MVAVSCVTLALVATNCSLICFRKHDSMEMILFKAGAMPSVAAGGLTRTATHIHAAPASAGHGHHDARTNAV